MKRLRRYLSRYWGLLALIIAIWGWMTDKITPAAILVMSVAAVGYFLLRHCSWDLPASNT